MTAAVTVSLAATTRWRAGTAMRVVRIRPVAYSPTMVRAPRLPAPIMSMQAAKALNASLRGLNLALSMAVKPGQLL
ncbi:hypothetical protein [Nonomuraea sp. NPDC049784]|uniref:hypothetical protein n=1 Tax=Nonomuraea sp. NPDC049784 TaxID=3154361 RepID=UPI0033CF169D